MEPKPSTEAVKDFWLDFHIAIRTGDRARIQTLLKPDFDINSIEPDDFWEQTPGQAEIATLFY